ncbi:MULTISPECIES: hypothetical protein [Sulfurimonas]|uniref:hypothetical protein n=1 Tax=Sulfurimonas TaxID=202746 RepID=UPI001FE7C61D|nr:hypothetical protein [Sulfurimonas indica]
MLNSVKTEAILVFSRTALERYFTEVEENDFELKVGTKEETEYVYTTLRYLTAKLQEVVVNVDYLLNLVQSAKTYPELRKIAKLEEPLINYYDAMAQQVSIYYKDKPAYMPEFLIICILSHWILEEEKSTDLYPFLKEIDFTELFYIFEKNREEFVKDDVCVVSDILNIATQTVEKLKKTKYKANTNRISKTRKKK